MASPQKERGHTPISNELLDEIIRARLRSTELSVVLWIARNTYGWSRRKTTTVGMRKMAEDMKTPFSSVHLAIRVLLEHNIIARDEHGRWSIQKDYDLWIQSDQPAGHRVLSNDQPAGQKVTSPLVKSDQPAGQLTSPLVKSDQPAGQSVDGHKTRKQLNRTSVKGNGDTNSDYQFPTLGEIVAYAMEINKPMDCRKFHDHYTANGWMRGKSPILDWRAVVRLWASDGPGAADRQPKKKKCRCGRDHCYPTVISNDGKTNICSTCRLEEDIAADTTPLPKLDKKIKVT